MTTIDPGHYPRLIGARLRELRKARCMTLRDVARAAGVNISNVSDAERASRGMPTLTTLSRYAQALDVGILDILSCLASPSAAVSASFAASDGLSGTPQSVQSPAPGLAAANHLTVLDAPFGLADVRELAARFAQRAVAERQSVQTPGAVVGAASVCSDSPSRELPDPLGLAAGAVALAAWSPCS